jgi:ketosteroid isomerase-like protein
MNPTELARSYWDAEESRDLDRILSHFEPDASWFGPGSDYHGASQFRRFYEDSIAGYPRLEVRIVETLGDPDRAAIRWEADLWDHDGRASRLDGMNLMSWRDGKITDLATFFDTSPLEA